jgi:hypothetical protein
MERDGVFVLISYTMTFLGFFFFLALGLAAYYGISFL